MSRPTPRVARWTWDRGTPQAVPGAKLRVRGATVFIPGRYLRRIADRLHDIADELEEVDR
ncbi:hypothetical protein [Brachybacterium sp. AOP35-5H-19]|uniref:hypothetical protein n=1 Tax=Brachybacterium sp. AOP35-5H-19 TaxID=3457685 RepID=UPI004034A106